MSNIIDKIQVSGVTYDIQGSGGGGITIDPTLDSGSTNPVANSAITTALDNKVNVVDNEVPDYNVTNKITYQGGYPSQTETASTWDDASMFTLMYNFWQASDVNYTTTAAVIDPSGNITTGSVTTSEYRIGNPLPDYIDMIREDGEFGSAKYYFTAKEGYRIAHLDIYSQSTWGSGYAYIIEERVDTVFEGGQSADVIKDVIEPTLINKQDKLVAGENITISGNVISSTGGDGKTLVAGRGIEITTADTTNTISFNLPISGTGFQSIAESGALSSDGYRSHAEGHNTVADGAVAHAEGNATQALGTNSHSEGNSTSALTSFSHAEGYYTKTTNQSEHASGQYNNSVSASTTFGNSGNTLFSVGNGTADNARHNAFEIRQNGDIYLNNGTSDVKLQDTITATAANTTALGGLSLVKLTQTQYDNLSTKDSNTLYVING